MGGRVVGVLACTAGDGSTLLSHLGILEVLAGHAAGALASALVHERTAGWAVTDALTGLPNRRAFADEYRGEVERATRYQRPLSVISIDLDHFKSINDQYGHAAGDTALQRSAEAIARTIRSTDRAYRLGGEELVVVCPETVAGAAAALAERLRAAVASPGPGPLVTASFGVAELPGHAGDGSGLLAAADRALYAAKHQGRDRVVVAHADVDRAVERTAIERTGHQRTATPLSA